MPMEFLLEFSFLQQGSAPFWVALSLLKLSSLSDSSDSIRQRNPTGNQDCPHVPGTAEFQPEHPQEVWKLPAAQPWDKSIPAILAAQQLTQFSQAGQEWHLEGPCDILSWLGASGIMREPETLRAVRDRSPNWIIHLKPSRELHKHWAEGPLQSWQVQSPVSCSEAPPQVNPNTV